jgi:hypothetical protein
MEGLSVSGAMAGAVRLPPRMSVAARLAGHRYSYLSGLPVSRPMAEWLHEQLRPCTVTTVAVAVQQR